ncbi:Kelch repeat-containing protein [Pseudoduganella sp. UC29_106]|uniref:Kelch repeat-containing protein n=1 Tax=Pseudoduganella sp. UC29_106 TaxID=3374553 RepID=UPI0037564132
MKKLILVAALAASQALAQEAPVARANWAVARAGGNVYTFYGLGAGKAYSDIERDVHALDLRSGKWSKVGDIPVEQGRLASAAVTVAGSVYLIGGYTVSAKGEEVSTPEVMRFTPDNGRFEVESRMPVAVDDSVALPWRDRWIVLVSGWHDTGNVADVQIYDTQTRQWSAATPYPGKPVFGHAGGLVQDTMVVCDGVTSAKGPGGKNQFAISNECWQARWMRSNWAASAGANCPPIPAHRCTALVLSAMKAASCSQAAAADRTTTTASATTSSHPNRPTRSSATIRRAAHGCRMSRCRNPAWTSAA